MSIWNTRLSAAARADEPPRLRDGVAGHATLAVVGIVTVLSVVRAFGPLTYPGDIWRQSDTATIARNFATDGMALFYPQINWGGAGPGYVETEFPLMPWLSAVLYLAFGEHPWLGRLVSLAFMLVATAAFWGLARRLLPVAAARWALVAFAVSPVFLRYGTAFMPEATVLAFYLLALLAFQRWLAEDRTRWLVTASASVSMAALAKPTSLHIGLVLLGWLLIAERSRLRRPSLYLAGLAALVAPGLWLWHAHTLYVRYGNTFGVLSGGDSKFGNLGYWTSIDFYAGNLRSEVLFVYGIVGVPLALLGGWRARGAVRAVLVAGFVALAVYYLAVARYSGSDMGIQYHVYSLPYAALLTGLGLEAVQDRVGDRWRTAVMALAVLLLGAQSVNVLVGSLPDRGGAFRVCADEVDALTGPYDLLAVSTTSASVDRGVPNNWQEPIVFYMADRKGWSVAADRHHPAVLAALRGEGADIFVVPDPALVPAGGELAGWLAANATQLRSAQRDGCGIWDLRSRPGAGASADRVGAP